MIATGFILQIVAVIQFKLASVEYSQSLFLTLKSVRELSEKNNSWLCALIYSYPTFFL
jgi:hypothetical protein